MTLTGSLGMLWNWGSRSNSDVKAPCNTDCIMYVTMFSTFLRGIYPSGNGRDPLSDENADEEKECGFYDTKKRCVTDAGRCSSCSTESLGISDRYFTRNLTDAELQPFTPLSTNFRFNALNSPRKQQRLVFLWISRTTNVVPLSLTTNDHVGGRLVTCWPDNVTRNQHGNKSEQCET